MRKKVLISCIHVDPQDPRVRERLAEEDIQCDFAEVKGQKLSEKDLLKLLPDYDGILAGDDDLTAAVIANAPRLKVIAKWGIGIDAIDVNAAQERGISVLNTPGVFGGEIADYALAYLLMLLRRQHEVDLSTRRGEWSKPRGRSTAGLTLGIVGLGSSGRELARRGSILGMTVIGADPTPPPPEVLEILGCRLAPLTEVLASSDVVSLHTPLSSATRGIVSAQLIDQMKPNSYLINTARGGLVDEIALLAALERGHLAGAALDVFETEPLPADSPLLDAPNLILGSHNASNTIEAVERTTSLAIDNLIRVLRG